MRACILALLLAAGRTVFGDIVIVESLEVQGDVQGKNDVSAVAVLGEQFVIASDETTSLQILKPSGKGRYQAGQPIVLVQGTSELDLEGLANDGRYLYAIGSHGAIREKSGDKDSPAANRMAIARVEHSANRNRLFRLKIDGDGTLEVPAHSISLDAILRDDLVLGRFHSIPSKENGVDIEGIAAHDGRLYCGFRGPVLRGNAVPILVLAFDYPSEYELRFVDLGGLGVRDLAQCSDGILILAGPVGEGPGDFQLYCWDGNDSLSAQVAGAGKARHLGQVPPPSTPAKRPKPEGITVLGETSDYFEVLVVFDGVPGGAPTRMRVDKTPPAR